MYGLSNGRLPMTLSEAGDHFPVLNLCNTHISGNVECFTERRYASAVYAIAYKPILSYVPLSVTNICGASRGPRASAELLVYSSSE